MNAQNTEKLHSSNINPVILNSLNINSRLIYVIDSKITKEELFSIITHSKIDFFSIETSNFYNVKEYIEIIENIKEICGMLKSHIGIIAQLAGRKIKVDSVNLPYANIQFNQNYLLKAGQTLKIISSDSSKKAKKIFNESIITVNFKEIHRVVKKNDLIVINDNKGQLKVLDIREVSEKTCSHNSLVACVLPRKLSSSEYYDMPNHRNSNSQENLKRQDLSPDKADKSSKFKIQIQERKTDSPKSIVSYESEEEEVYQQYEVMQTEEDNDEEKYIYKSKKIDKYFNITSRKFSIYCNLENNPGDYFYNKNGENECSEIGHTEDNLNINNNCVQLEKPPASFIEYNKFAKKVTNINAKHRRNLTTTNFIHTSENNDKRLKICTNSKNKIKKHEIICSVEYDCFINTNSFLFIPNLDYVEHGIDVLSQREVREINTLYDLGVDYICISIKNLKDIESIKEINPEVKIISSLPDFSCLRNLDDILKNSYGIILSRTFHIINENTKSSLIRISKNVIYKCREYGKPIFSFLDLNNNYINFNENSEILNCMADGLDGFFLTLSQNIQINRINIIESLVSRFSELKSDGQCHIKNFNNYILAR
jgi:hypothetical protein